MTGWALLITALIVVLSAFIYTPGIGHGGWLMLTIPGAPIIFLVVRLALRLTSSTTGRPSR